MWAGDGRARCQGAVRLKHGWTRVSDSLAAGIRVDCEASLLDLFNECRTLGSRSAGRNER